MTHGNDYGNPGGTVDLGDDDFDDGGDNDVLAISHGCEDTISIP